MRTVLIVAAIGEIATGTALLLAPSLVGQLLLGLELVSVSIILARLVGIALIGLGIACWPGTPLLGMLVYNIAIAMFLAWAGVTGSADGMLLWPVVGLHALLTALLGRAWLAMRSSKQAQ